MVEPKVKTTITPKTESKDTATKTVDPEEEPRTGATGELIAPDGKSGDDILPASERSDENVDEDAEGETLPSINDMFNELAAEILRQIPEGVFQSQVLNSLTAVQMRVAELMI